ncbi:MAG: hypothetical protein LBP73_04195 [Clostridiales Family XIII bacterium]|jgi:hypothetical protein|nr:hypothetical protein [Clostridiales Family XIII bacterium]
MDIKKNKPLNVDAILNAVDAGIIWIATIFIDEAPFKYIFPLCSILLIWHNSYYTSRYGHIARNRGFKNIFMPKFIFCLPSWLIVSILIISSLIPIIIKVQYNAISLDTYFQYLPNNIFGALICASIIIYTKYLKNFQQFDLLRQDSRFFLLMENFMVYFALMTGFLFSKTREIYLPYEFYNAIHLTIVIYLSIVVFTFHTIFLLRNKRKNEISKEKLIPKWTILFAFLYVVSYSMPFLGKDEKMRAHLIIENSAKIQLLIFIVVLILTWGFVYRHYDGGELKKSNMLVYILLFSIWYFLKILISEGGENSGNVSSLWSTLYTYCPFLGLVVSFACLFAYAKHIKK